MRRTLLRPLGFALATVLGVSVAHAQAPKPGPEQKKLEVALGSWTYEGDAKASVFGPAGKWTGVERFQWLPGGFFLQMNREAKGPAGAVQHSIIYGYDPVGKRHTGQFFDFTGGNSASATIVIAGNTWNWSAAGYTGDGKAFQERCAVTFATGGGSYTVKCEVATDGKTWSPSFESKATKSK